MGTFHSSSELGTLGEELGCRYLKEKGFRVRETNYCNAFGKRLGEIDIVAENREGLVFVEVKSRIGSASSGIVPEANITAAKLRKLERIAQCYLREKKCVTMDYRFDALSILYDPRLKKASIRHLEHIFL